MSASPETFEFKAETRRLLDLMIHSLYSNKEIFLRELISNASDAIDRYRFEALTDESLSSDLPLEIRIDVDKDARTITIHDTGIGMSREEVVENIGTIAKSGTGETLKKLQEAGKSQEELATLIGQFGVGFYASFMVADRVVLVTRRAGQDNAVRWESEGDGAYTLSEATRASRGTSITLHLKEADPENGLEDFTTPWVLSRIVKRYSDFVRYPIITKKERVEVEKDEEGNPKEDGETTTIIEDETLNSMKPLWMRSKDDITEEEHTEFYKQIAHAWEAPLKSIPIKVEGRLEYRALLYLPKKAPFDMYQHKDDRGLRLYVRNVLIMEHCKDLLPMYLRFVQGVVDSSDLSLNVSRELLQQDRHITTMRKFLVKKILGEIKWMCNEEKDTYLEFWEEFGRPLKEGAINDFENREKLMELLLFESSADEKKLTSLKDYIERMKEGQDKIYFQTGGSRPEIESSPHLEAFRDKGYEVLYCVDPIDEMLFQSIRDFDSKQFQSVGKGEVELGDEKEKEETKKELEAKQEEFKGLIDYLKEQLKDHVKDVRLSSRLTSSPACLVGGEFDYSPHLEQLLGQSQKMPQQKRTLELNPKHTILEQFKAQHSDNPDSERWGDYADILMGYALLAEGSKLPDPNRFNQAVMGLMSRELQ